MGPISVGIANQIDSASAFLGRKINSPGDVATDRVRASDRSGAFVLQHSHGCRTPQLTYAT